LVAAEPPPREGRAAGVGDALLERMERNAFDLLALRSASGLGREGLIG
jgi:hypothetical protein